MFGNSTALWSFKPSVHQSAVLGKPLTGDLLELNLMSSTRARFLRLFTGDLLVKPSIRALFWEAFTGALLDLNHGERYLMGVHECYESRSDTVCYDVLNPEPCGGLPSHILCSSVNRSWHREFGRARADTPVISLANVALQADYSDDVHHPL